MSVKQLCRLPGGEDAVRQLALAKAQANPSALEALVDKLAEQIARAKAQPTLEALTPLVSMIDKRHLCAFLNDNDLEWLCQQPGYRPHLEELAAQRLREDPGDLPEGQDAATFVKQASTQRLCAMLKRVNDIDKAIPVCSHVEMTGMALSMSLTKPSPSFQHGNRRPC